MVSSPDCLGYYRPNVYVYASFTHVNFILIFKNLFNLKIIVSENNSLIINISFLHRRDSVKLGKSPVTLLNIHDFYSIDWLCQHDHVLYIIFSFKYQNDREKFSAY